MTGDTADKKSSTSNPADPQTESAHNDVPFTMPSSICPTDTTSAHTTLSPNPTEARVSWIYQLKKDELINELTKFGLDTSGTTDILRKRLSNFIKSGAATPAPSTQIFTFPVPATSDSQPRNPIPTPAITVQGQDIPVTHVTAPLKIHKWNIQFNGRTDPVAFIERLEEICTAEGIVLDRLLPSMPELLQGEASLWYRNNRKNWHTWDEFLQNFRSFYFPINYAADLEIEISRRLQRPNESPHRYITDMQTLIRRHGNMSPEQELQWLYRNLLPEYRQYIRKTDFTDVVTLSRIIREVELLLTELRAVPSYPSRPAGISVTNTSTRNPRTPGPSFQQNHQICWKCGQPGHFRSECRGTARLFCSRCGKNGIMSRDCPCNRSEN